jgi:hypothetical protein
MARLLVEKLEFDAPEIRSSSPPRFPNVRSASNVEASHTETCCVYVASPQIAAARRLLKDACDEVGASFEECSFEQTLLKLYRLPADWL